MTRRPEDNGKKMVSKKKFINYKNHFEGGGSDNNKLIFCVKSIVHCDKIRVT